MISTLRMFLLAIFINTSLLSSGNPVEKSYSRHEQKAVNAIETLNLDLLKEAFNEDNGIVNLNYKGITLLAGAVMINKYEMVEFLLDNGANVNVKDEDLGNTPLHCAVLAQNLDIIKLLIDHGVDLNSVNSEGQTPIMLSTFGHKIKNFEMIHFFIRKRVNLTCQDRSGKTFFDYYKTFEDYLKFLYPNYKKSS